MLVGDSQMRVTIRYFAIVRERLGTGRETVELAAGATLEDLLETLSERHPPLRELLPHLRFALGLDFADLDTPLTDGCEVSLLPPVAGGAPGARFVVTGKPLSEQDVVVQADARHGEMGGLCTFVGVVRRRSKGRDVERLEYEAHEEMAAAVLERIGGECEERWPGCRVAIHHRVGVLRPGDLAVVIAVAAPHRAEAFAGCRHAIERLKEDVPIWKREVGPDGSEWVGMGP